MPLFGKKKTEKVAIDNAASDGHGQVTLPNPGELPPNWEENGMPLQSLGTRPGRGNRAGGGAFMDNGARVGYLRNLEFSAGGRSALVKTGTMSTSVPNISPITGQVQVSSLHDTSPSAGNVRSDQPAMPGLAKTEGDQVDAAVSAGPERKRDRRLD